MVPLPIRLGHNQDVPLGIYVCMYVDGCTGSTPNTSAGPPGKCHCLDLECDIYIRT